MQCKCLTSKRLHSYSGIHVAREILQPAVLRLFWHQVSERAILLPVSCASAVVASVVWACLLLYLDPGFLSTIIDLVHERRRALGHHHSPQNAFSQRLARPRSLSQFGHGRLRRFVCVDRVHGCVEDLLASFQDTEHEVSHGQVNIVRTIRIRELLSCPNQADHNLRRSIANQPTHHAALS
jgi:hypothetical protein